MIIEPWISCWQPVSDITKDDGAIMVVRLLAPATIKLPTDVTLIGIVNVVIPVKANATSPIEVTLEGINKEVNKLHCQNANAPLW